MKTVMIDGMMCQRCAAHAKEALEKIGTDVKVNLEEGKATLCTEATDDKIKEVIEEAGYEVTEII